MSSRKLKLAILGLGGIGSRHALHFHTLTPRAELIAVSSPEPKELEWAKRTLGGDVRTYLDYDDMLRSETDLEAVVIASATVVHAQQTIKAIERGLHVLCEKPLSTSLEECESVLHAYNRSLQKNPSQKVLCGFSRRFDASYRDTYAKICSGMIGHPSVFRSQTCDKLDPSSSGSKSGALVRKASASGGIFIDCGIHDIDLALWFLGEGEDTLLVKSVCAMGITALEPELRACNDRDNAVGIVEFYGGEKIAQFFCSRMNVAGQEDSTEITGSAGKLSVNAHPALNLVNVYESTGIRREIPQGYYDRYREAFIAEANEFTACCLDDSELPMRLEDAVMAVRIAAALQESLVTGRKIEFDERGERVN